MTILYAIAGVLVAVFLILRITRMPGGNETTTKHGGAICAAFFVTVACSNVSPSDQLEPVREGQETFISRAVFAEGRLWLLSDGGQMFTLTEQADERTEVVLPDPALELWLWDGKPAIATCPRTNCENWALRRWLNGAWHIEAIVPNWNDDLLAVNSDGATTLLTSRRIATLVNGATSTVTLSIPLRNDPPVSPLDYARVTSVAFTAQNLYVGLNAGEWGGGLRSIDRNTGTIAVVESNASGDLCGGPLNTECDPVNGVIVEPGKPHCVVAAIGLVHMATRGRIVEVCGAAIRRIYFKPFDDGSGKSPILEGQDEPFSTVSFFGLIRHQDDKWAVGIDGLYRFGLEGAPQIVSLPKFKAVGGVYVSFDLPDIVVVLTDINSRNAVSGSTPMLVSR